MKKRSRRIIYHAVTSPLILFLIIALGIPSLGYLFYKQSYILSYHENVTKESINTKINSLKKWITDAKNEVEAIASSQIIKMSILAQEYKPQDTKSYKPKHKDLTNEPSRLKTRSFLEAKVTDKRFSLISIISQDGRITDSTSQELINHSILETDLYQTLKTKGDRTIIIGFWKDGDNHYVIDLITPLKDNENTIKGYIHCALNMDTVRSILADKPNHVISYDITDKQGNVLVSSANSIKERQRYNPQILNTADRPQFIGNEVIYTAPLRDIDLIVVQRTKLIDVMRPVIEVSVLYVFILCLVIFIFIRQASYLRKKVIKPLLSLVSSMRSASAGIQTITIKGQYPYEIDNLIQEINRLIDEMAKDKNIEDTSKTVDETTIPKDKKTQDTTRYQIDIEADKYDLYNMVSEVLEDAEGQKTYRSIRQRLVSLVCLVEGYRFLKAIDVDESTQDISLKDLFAYMDEEVSKLRSVTKTEAIFEYDEKLNDEYIKTRADILFRAISTILHNAFAHTIEGTVTVFCRRDEDPTKHLLILISDNYGDDKENQLISLARHLCDSLGYDLSVDTIKDKGTTYCLRINQ
ncbi:MAG: cache domain-containing protein [Thermodesulfovibrionales bacterium]